MAPTKADLIIQVQHLEQQVALANQVAENPSPSDDAVEFIKCPDGAVGLYTKSGSPIGLLSSSQWANIVARMSVGGANGENIRSAMRLHEGR